MICFPLTYLSYKHMIMVACKWLFMNIKNFVPKVKAHRPIRPPEMKFKERSYIFGCPLIGISHSRMQQRNKVTYLTILAFDSLNAFPSESKD